MARKRALLVGINKYPTAPLRGCVNDVTLVSEMLTKHFGFETKDKRMLTDESATTENIMERLHWLVEDAQPGDVLYFHYSGHGSQSIDSKYDTDEEPDGLDELICPVDLNWRDKVIKDDDLKRIFDTVPAGVYLTVFLDCCHSGTGLDDETQYQPLGVAAMAREFGPDSPNRSRLLPMPADIANRGFGLDLKPRPRSVQRVQQNSTALLISGCQSHQTSADAWIDNMYVGAASYAFLTLMEQNNYNLRYGKLVENMNDFMVNHKFSQRPELNGSEYLFDNKVLKAKKENGADEEIVTHVEENVESDSFVPELPVVPYVEIPEGSQQEGSAKTKTIALTVIVIVAIIALVASGVI